MKMILRQLLILVVLLLPAILLGCSNRSNTDLNSIEESFKTAVPVVDMNNSLEIKIYEDQKTFPRGSDIRLLVENKSSHFLLFNSGDDYIKLFMSRGTDWVEVNNKITYSGTRILSPQGTPLLNLNATWAQPILDDNAFEDNKAEVPLRIVMVGEIMEDDKPTGKLVGAYVDVHITP